MKQIAREEIEERYSFDNPWWESGEPSNLIFEVLPRRAYVEPFCKLLSMGKPVRALVLMGPRRVGKTVLLHHSISNLLSSGVPAQNILYISIDTPIYTGVALERHLKYYKQKFQHDDKQQLYLFFDEIQYLPGWEVHLKSLVDSYPQHKFVASGSAAAALKMKSVESGAGRFSDFLLPPLTFAEYLQFIGMEEILISTVQSDGRSTFITNDINELNRHFIDYLNYGGYPEAAFSEEIRDNPALFIKSDIIDKVLLRDLPSLYGIQDISELNRIFTMAAYNTGEEISLDGLSQGSGVAKNTIKKYLEYLEAAFLIKRVRRVDDKASRFQRDRSYKVYLTNPAMRAALFGPVDADSPDMGHLTETAIFGQWFHNQQSLAKNYYARWDGGEVDIVGVFEPDKSKWAVEIKWSDRPIRDHSRIKGILEFASKNTLLSPPLVTTRTITDSRVINGIKVEFTPSSLYCYTVGKNLVQSQT